MIKMQVQRYNDQTVILLESGESAIVQGTKNKLKLINSKGLISCEELKA